MSFVKVQKKCVLVPVCETAKLSSGSREAKFPAGISSSPDVVLHCPEYHTEHQNLEGRDEHLLSKPTGVAVVAKQCVYLPIHIE